MSGMEQTEMRIGPDETIYIVNCSGKEAKQILAITEDGAETTFESSVACIGASICQLGARDSQKLLKTLIDASREWGYEDGVLPRIHISGCLSSCGTHQIGRIGFRGGVKTVNGKPEPAFVLTVNGNDAEGAECFGEQAGTVLEAEVPAFMKELGACIQQTGMKFDEWYEKHRDRFFEIAKPYVE